MTRRSAGIRRRASGFRYNQDNGGGYYNYYLYQGGEEVRFKTRDWEVKGTAGGGYYSFPVQAVIVPPPLEDFQPVPVLIPSPKLYLGLINLKLRAERRVWKSLRIFAEYNYQRLVSNRPESQYAENQASGGLSWEF